MNKPATNKNHYNLRVQTPCRVDLQTDFGGVFGKNFIEIWYKNENGETEIDLFYYDDVKKMKKDTNTIEKKIKLLNEREAAKKEK